MTPVYSEHCYGIHTEKKLKKPTETYSNTNVTSHCITVVGFNTTTVRLVVTVYTGPQAVLYIPDTVEANRLYVVLNYSN